MKLAAPTDRLESSQPASRILIVDDDPMTVRLLARMLSGSGEISFAKDGIDALKRIAQSAPDLILCDGEMPGMSGGALLQRLQADPKLADIPLIFVTGHNDPAFEVRCFAQGAVDFVSKPVNPPVLLARVATHLRLRRLNAELRATARRDALTGVSSRRVLDEELPQELLRAVRTGSPLSLLMLDVDHFKLYNDHYGHPAGDACLRTIAEVMGTVVRRGTDMVVRYGGEEFAMLLPMTPAIGARIVAERLLDQLNARAIPHAASLVGPYVTASIGLCTFDPASESGAPAAPVDAQQLVRIADQGLYQAKRDGRNTARALPFTARDAAVDAPTLAPPSSASRTSADSHTGIDGGEKSRCGLQSARGLRDF